MNIPLMKRIDGTIGKTVARLLPPSPHRPFASPPRSILLIRPGGIGDAVHLAPAIQTLRSHFPRLSVTILAEERNASIFPLIDGTLRVLCYDRPSELLRAIWPRYDLVIDTEQWHRLSAVISRLVSARRRIGFGTNRERSRLFTDPLPYDHDRYEAEMFLSLITPLGIELPGSIPPPWLSIPPSTDIQIQRHLAPLDGERFITIFPGASIPQRRWGAERFGVIVRTLADRGVKSVIVGGKGEREEGRRLAADGALDLTGATTLPETAGILARSRLLLSGDSGVLHMAVGLGVPTISLFGPGRWLKWGPRGEGDRILRVSLPCSPCTTFGTTPPCPRGCLCMQGITPDQVLDAIFAMVPHSS